MLYKLMLDENLYLTGFVHTGTIADTYDLDPTKMELDFLNCYHLVDGVLWLDNAKKEQIIAEEKRKEEEFIPVDDRLEALEESTLDIGTNIGIENEISVADRLDAIEEAILEIIGG